MCEIKNLSNDDLFVFNYRSSLLSKWAKHGVFKIKTYPGYGPEGFLTGRFKCSFKPHDGGEKIYCVTDWPLVGIFDLCEQLQDAANDQRKQAIKNGG